VRVVEPSELKGLGDVIIGSVGLTGFITLAALGFGVVLASLIVAYRKLLARSESEDDAAKTQPLGITPAARKSPIPRS
jgi:hypothetical protein